jgi:hypothetical protein
MTRTRDSAFIWPSWRLRITSRSASSKFPEPIVADSVFSHRRSCKGHIHTHTHTHTACHVNGGPRGRLGGGGA